MKSVDLMIAFHNRIEFSRECLWHLRRNTDWSLIRKLTLYNVGSVDSTAEYLEWARTGYFGDVNCKVVHLPVMHIVALQSRHMTAADAPMLAKIDNDTAMPPQWLEKSLAVFDRHPELYMLGLEAFTPQDPNAKIGDYSYRMAEYISGLAIWKKECFATSAPVAMAGRRGLEEWQQHVVPKLTRGWILPALDVFLMDHLPFEPYLSRSNYYEGRLWQRPCPKYPVDCKLWAWANFPEVLQT